MIKPRPSQRIEYLTRYGFIFFLLLLMLTVLITALWQGKLHRPLFMSNYQNIQQQNLQAISQDIHTFYLTYGRLPNNLYELDTRPYYTDPETNELYGYYALSSTTYELCLSSYHDYHPAFWFFFGPEERDVDNCSIYSVPEITQ